MVKDFPVSVADRGNVIWISAVRVTNDEWVPRLSFWSTRLLRRRLHFAVHPEWIHNFPCAEVAAESQEPWAGALELWQYSSATFFATSTTFCEWAWGRAHGAYESLSFLSRVVVDAKGRNRSNSFFHQRDSNRWLRDPTKADRPENLAF